MIKVMKRTYDAKRIDAKKDIANIYIIYKM